MKCLLSFCLLVAVLLGVHAEDASGPVGKVVHLLNDLKAKIDKDADADEKDYEEHACWCKRVEASKEEMIAEETRIIEEKTQEISAGQAEDNKLDKTILVQVEEIKDNKVGQEDATVVRQRQHGDSVSESKDNEQQIHDIAEGEDAVKNLSSSGHASQVVEDQLKVMGHKIELDENQNKETDTKANDSFTQLIDGMTESLALLENENKETKVEEGQTEEEIAEDIEVKADTQTQLEADKAFLKEATTSCNERKVEYQQRSGLRATEIAGVNKALDILDKKRELLSSTFKDVKLSFLQLYNGVNSETSMAARSAIAVLKAQATKTHSLRLGLVAARLRKATRGGEGIQEVLDSIEKMMKKMKSEAASDTKKKDSCKKEYLEINKKAQKLAFLSQKSTTQMEKLEVRLSKLKDDKAVAEKEIAETNATLQEAEKLRTDENSAFTAAKADDELAIKVLAETSEAMKKYYDEVAAKQASAFVQYDPEDLSDKRKQLKRQENKYDLTDELSQENGANAILATLEHITGNLRKEIEDAKEEEKKAQLDFEKSRDLLLDSEAKLRKKVSDLSGIISKANEEHSSADDSKTKADSDLVDQAAYKDSIKEGCDYILSHFDQRASDRESEMDGLVRAKALLSGSSLMQKDVQVHQASKSVVGDDQSTLMNYLGLA